MFLNNFDVLILKKNLNFFYNIFLNKKQFKFYFHANSNNKLLAVIMTSCRGRCRYVL